MKRGWWVYAVPALLGTAAYPLLPDTARMVWYDALSVSVVAALLIGACRLPRDERLPWYLFAGGQLCYSVADVSWNAVNAHLGYVPTPSLVDVAYLAYYPPVALGLILLARRRSRRGQALALVDALTAGTGVALVMWVVARPSVVTAGMSGAGRVVTLAYPAADLVLLVLSLRMAMGPGRRSVAFRLLVASMLLTTLTDLLYLATTTRGWDLPTPVTDIGWLLGYLTFGCAALHPTMRSLGRPSMEAAERPTPLRRKALLAASGLFAPGVLVLGPAIGERADVAAFAVGATLLYLLMLSRLFGVVRRQERAIVRERVLHVAGRRLVSAASIEDVRQAAVDAARELAGRAYPVDVLMADEAGDPTADGLAIPLMIQDECRGAIVVRGPHRPPSGVRASLVALATDVALAQEAVLQHARREHGERRFRSIALSSSDLMVITDPRGTITWCSESIERVGGYPVAELLGRPVSAFLHPGDGDSLDRLWHARGSSACALGDWRMRISDGSYRVFQVTGRNLLDDPAVGGLLLAGPDVTERRLMEDELRKQALHDTLTGLANRVLFVDRLRHALVRRRAGGPELAVLFIDLDDFKTVNDSLGHQIGDDLLVAVARRLGSAVRSADTAARFGGDEFAILLEDAGETQATGAAQCILETFEAPFTVGGREVFVRASIGMATADWHVTAPETLLRNADVAMYRAKSAGGNGFEVFRPSMHAEAMHRLELRADLERALERDELVLYYQPVMDLATGYPASFEALIRWQHPGRGLLEPGHFVPIAEETGLIVPIGRWVLRTACVQARAWQRLFGLPLAMAVNVSIRQLADDGLVDDVAQALRDSGLDAASLTLELTESAFMSDVDAAVARVKEIKSLGVRIAIDDFGTGYSSLSYLDRIPADIIKIDRSFVSLLMESGERPPLVQMILDLARNLNVQTVAEGVEHQSQFQRLRELGCFLGQGFLFSRPLDPRSMEALLASGALDTRSSLAA
jgi:diguanylate cyclase (GGDEF)-like protein/PAS domain S-box-containing protein